MQDLLVSQRRYFNSKATLPLRFRIEQLKKLKAVITKSEKSLFEAINSDFKKSEFETFISELSLVYHDIDDSIKNLQNWARKKKVSSTLINFPSKAYILYEPLGVTLVIGAWNYPYLLTFSPLVAAMAAGCTTVIKPSEIPAKTSAEINRIITETFSSEYIAVVEGGVPETTELLKQKFDKIFFTGSTKVGKIVYEAAAKNLTPVTLELGGKSPTFVTEDAQLKLTAKRLVWAKFFNAGQTCIAPDYVLVHKNIEQDFLQACKKEIESQQYSFQHKNYPQIINSDNLERLQGLLQKDKIYCGGKVDKEQRYFEPTILQHVTFEDPVMQEEIFGPILPVIAYEDLEEAIATVKGLPKPLSCYVFTRSKAAKKKILREISFGGGMVNDAVMHITNSKLPFGGVGMSGIGAYHGEAGFKTFSHAKSIIEKSNLIEFPLKYFPHTKKKLWWIKLLTGRL